jgi:tetratricopeptide (TPR) repeat protein
MTPAQGFPVVLLLTLALLGLSGCRSAASQMAAGDVLYARAEYAEALDLFRAARDSDPTLDGVQQKIRDAEVQLQVQRGDAAAEGGRWSEAERLYAEALRLDPATPLVEQRLRQMAAQRAAEHFLKGQQLLGRGNPFDAIAEFEQALASDPSHPRAQEALQRAVEEKAEREGKAEVSFQQGLRALAEERLEEAVEHFAAALNVHPHHPTAARELDRAKAQFAEAAMAAGDAAAGRREWSEALRAYRAAQGHGRRLSGLSQRIQRAQREWRAEKLTREANEAFDRGEWRTAFERFSEARDLTSDQGAFITRLESARDRLAAESYAQAVAAEEKRRFAEAIAGYRAVEDVRPGYEDAKERAQRLDVALRTAERTYEAGCRAQEEKDLVEARDRFRVAEESCPGFRDVAERRRAVGDALARAEKLYLEASQEEARNQLERAQVLFANCLAVATPFRDAAEKLERVRTRSAESGSIEERYEKAARAHEARDLERARNLLSSCAKSQAGYRDVAARLREVEAALAAARERYDLAVQTEEQCVLDRALALYEECLAKTAPFQDAEARLERVNAALKALAEAAGLEREKRLSEAQKLYQRVLERCAGHVEARRGVERTGNTLEQVRRTYRALLEAQRKGRSTVALSYANEIRRQCAGFEDVDARAVVLEAEVDYAQGLDYEAEERWDEAVRCFERAAKRSPGLRDVEERLRQSKERRDLRVR